MSEPTALKRTRLYRLHIQAGAKMVPFAGYEMPLGYPPGIIREHLHTRSKAGLFDVSHMGQIRVSGADAALHLESLIPSDIISLAVGKQKYALLLNEKGGIIDDLIIARVARTEFILVVNAPCKINDFNYLKSKLDKKVKLDLVHDRSLLALQGPKSPDVMEQSGHNLSNMPFMSVNQITLNGSPCLISRSGYTGEDGFEISIHNDHAVTVAESLLSNPEVAWAGLGARDSLRMEAGLPLHGHDITEDTTPVEAGLSWAVAKARRSQGARAGGFPGDHIVLPQIAGRVSSRLVGLQPVGKAPVRESAALEDDHGNPVGAVTSGGFSPTLGKPICLGYVDLKYADPADMEMDAGRDAERATLHAVVRNRRLPVRVTRLPFVKHNYYRPR